MIFNTAPLAPRIKPNVNDGIPSDEPCWLTIKHAVRFWTNLRNCSVLLISGHYQLSSNRSCTGERRDRAAFLKGVEKDLQNMRRLVELASSGGVNQGCDLFDEYNSPDDCTIEEAMRRIERLIAHCLAHGKRPLI